MADLGGLAPGEWLARLLELATLGLGRKLLEDEQDELCRGLVELDGWLVRGGFWPERWAGRGVNLQLADRDGRLGAEIERVRGLLMAQGRQIVLPAAQPQLIVAVPFEPGQDGRIVAGLASHAAFAGDPVEAVRQLHAKLEETLRKVGQA